MQFIYQARLEPADDEVLVTIPDVPMVATTGNDEAEALASAADALATALRRLVKEGRDIPLPVTPAQPDLHPVPLGAFDALKLAVVLAFRSSGLTKLEFAARLGRANSEAHRILDPHHPTKVAMLESALSVLGKRAVVEIQDAA